MERKIQWHSGYFDEDGLVYGKAAEKEVTKRYYLSWKMEP